MTPLDDKQTAPAAEPTAGDCCVILESVASRVIARAIYAAGVAVLPNGMKAVADAMETTARGFLDEVYAMAHLGKRMGGPVVQMQIEAARILEGINDALREWWEASEYTAGPLLRTAFLEKLAEEIAGFEDDEDAGGDGPAAE